MSITLKHIGLQVVEKDIESFYVDLLDFKILRSFSLSENDADNIFGINKPINILYGTCGKFDLELFIDNDFSLPTFAHLCIGIKQPTNIIHKAQGKGYKTFIRKNNNRETFFISDSNHNIFEIKDSEE